MSIESGVAICIRLGHPGDCRCWCAVDRAGNTLVKCVGCGRRRALIAANPCDECWQKAHTPPAPTVETTMGEIAGRLTELAREEIEACSCDESLALRDRLAIAARGKVALHVVKEAGYWTVERWIDGWLVESYVGVPTVADALLRIGEWMNDQRNELQVNVTGNGDRK